MTIQTLQKWTVEGLEVLVFQIQGILFAVDLEQIDEMLDPNRDEGTAVEATALHELIPFPKAPVLYEDPRILMIDYQGMIFGIKVDQPETISYLSLEVIHPFPLLLEASRMNDALWGVGLVEERPALLLDCFKLAARMRASRCLTRT